MLSATPASTPNPTLPAALPAALPQNQQHRPLNQANQRRDQTYSGPV